MEAAKSWERIEQEVLQTVIDLLKQNRTFLCDGSMVGAILV